MHSNANITDITAGNISSRKQIVKSTLLVKCLMRAEAKCLYCNKICIDKDVLYMHINKHHSAVKILCNVFTCHQYFHTQTEADEHFEQKHQKIVENKKYCCLKCNFRSARKCTLRLHISRMHGEKLLLCPKCSKCFT
jgi:hypothetical protein